MNGSDDDNKLFDLCYFDVESFVQILARTMEIIKLNITTIILFLNARNIIYSGLENLLNIKDITNGPKLIHPIFGGYFLLY